METNKKDELTLKEFLLKIKEFYDELKAKWKYFLFIVLVSIGIFFIKYLNQESLYISEVRFVVEGSGSSGGLANLLGGFGFNTNLNKVNHYKILEVGKSSRILKHVLSDSIGNTILANKILDDLKIMKDDEDLSNFRYNRKLVNQDLTKEENSVLKKIIIAIWGSKDDPSIGLSTFRIDEDSGIFELGTKSTNQELSYTISTSLYHYIKKFFEQEIFEKQKQLVQILEIKSDSLRLLGVQKQRELAKFEEQSRGLISKIELTKSRIIKQEQLAISTAYAEVLKNKEIVDVKVKDVQPLFMEIDYPYMPLDEEIPSLKRSILLGVILGAILGIFFISVRKLIIDSLNS